jgi:conjugal transfer pilus assembly protein TraU
LRHLSKIILVVFIILLPAPEAYSVCKGTFLNPVTDVCWHCIFPIKIAGIVVYGGTQEDAPDPAVSPLCICPAPPPVFVRVGIPLSFWEPAQYIETVKDPFCFPGLGTGFENPSSGFYAGDSSSSDEAYSTFAQAHYFIFPVWSMLELMVDSVCVETSGFDLAYMTEIDPLWNDDMLSAYINPEAALFGNIVTQLACMPDAVAANAGFPLSPLFWCMGSWGSAYPMTGTMDYDEDVQAHAAIASRFIYKLARQMLICDTGINLCSCVPTPLWVKHNYKMHITKPVRDVTCHPIGRSSLIWGAGKNPPYEGDNFLWMIFRKRACCAY